MNEKLPAEHGEVRPEISELIESDGWLPLTAADPDHEPDEPQRPETD